MPTARGRDPRTVFPAAPSRHQNFDPAQLFQWLRDLITSDVRIVTQNGLYDWGWLRAEAGILMPPSERLEEIGALATMVDENRYATAWTRCAPGAVSPARTKLCSKKAQACGLSD